jgi:dCMP deaminase
MKENRPGEKLIVKMMQTLHSPYRVVIVFSYTSRSIQLKLRNMRHPINYCQYHKFAPQVGQLFLKHIKQSILKKRQDYISWDEYFMGVALLSAKRSKDPSTQVGACIVNDKNKIVGAGYNGLPIGCHDDDFPWDKEGEFLDTKYPFICHAELNAILNNIGMDLHGCKIYSALFPCNECTKAIIQSGIREVIYLSDKYAGNDIFKASKIMLDTAGVRYRKVESTITSLLLSYIETDV